MQLFPPEITWLLEMKAFYFCNINIVNRKLRVKLFHSFKLKFSTKQGHVCHVADIHVNNCRNFISSFISFLWQKILIKVKEKHSQIVMLVQIFPDGACSLKQRSK